VAPNLLFHPVFDEAEALAGMPHRKVVHPTAQYRVDQLHDPIHWLRLVAAEYILELPLQRRSLLELRRVTGTPCPPRKPKLHEKRRLVIGEFPDEKAAASAVLAAAAGGSLSDIETTVAMTAKDAATTFESAGKAAKAFRSAGPLIGSR
jgi:hypothetical protein